MEGKTEHRESDTQATADVWLRAVSSFDYPTFFEYAGLSIEGRVHIDASSCVVEGRNRFYEIENRSGNEMLFCTSETDSKSFEDIDLREMQCTMIGLARLNATTKAEGKWIHDAPGMRFLSSIPTDEIFRDSSHTIHSQSYLTLADLGEIFEWIARLQKNESETSSDPLFLNLFPSSFRDCLRHRSGHEVLLYRDQNGNIKSHRIDAQNPADELYSSWLASVKRNPPRTGSYASLRRKRWQLANLLGSISESRKPEVFNWVSDTMWKLEEYESSHGRQPMTQKLEYYFDDSVIFANEKMEFELIKM